MRVLLRELASSAHACALDAAVISAKMRLDSLDSEVMSSASPTECAARRTQNPYARFPSGATSHTRANLPPLRVRHRRRQRAIHLVSGQEPAHMEQKTNFEHEAYGNTITQVLSEQLLEDRQWAHAMSTPPVPPLPPRSLLPRKAPLVLATRARWTYQCAVSAGRGDTRPMLAGTTPRPQTSASLLAPQETPLLPDALPQRGRPPKLL